MASMGLVGADLGQHLRAEPLAAALRPRLLRPGRGSYAAHVHVVVLAAGSLELGPEDEPTRLSAPAALILPPGEDWQLGLEAGSEGWLFGLSAPLLGEVMGARPELELMMPLGRQVILAPDLAGEGPLGPESLCAALLAEVEATAAGRRIVLLAYLRLLIVAIWRASHQEAVPPHFGSEAHLLEQFRREVEQHFRSHRAVGDYALRLGVSPSRLRRICQRHLGNTPLELIHRRLLREARAWLEHSGLNVAEIAQALGFADSAEFSHFFKRGTGLAPSHFRAGLRDGDARLLDSAASFADWP